MAQTRIQSEWNQTSHLMAVLININRGKNARVVKPNELNPYAKAQTAKQKPDFYITPGQLAQKIVGKQQPSNS